MGIRRLLCRGDPDLVVQQVMKTFNTKHPRMVAYCSAVRQLEGKFDGIELHHVKRSDNGAAYTIDRMGATREPVPAETFLEHLHKPSVKLEAEPEEVPASLDMRTAGDGLQLLKQKSTQTQPSLSYQHGPNHCSRTLSTGSSQGQK